METPNDDKRTEGILAAMVGDDGTGFDPPKVFAEYLLAKDPFIAVVQSHQFIERELWFAVRKKSALLWSA